MRLERLNSERFGISNHEMSWWNLFEDVNAFEKFLDNRLVLSVVDRYAVGFCDGGSVVFRQSPNSFAILFEKDGCDFWFNIPKSSFDQFVTLKSFA